MLMGITEYARHREFKLQAVQYAVKAGRIPRTADGLIDSDEADRAWEQNTLETMARPGRKSTAVDDASTQANKTDGIEPVPGMTYTQARALKEVYEAQRRKLDVQVRERELISRREVETEVFNQFRLLRDSCFNLPPRLAAQLAAESDEATVYEIIEGAIRRVFEDFAEGRLQ
jgi:hypothetical protein